MKVYKYRNDCWKIETDNALIVVTNNLSDTKGRKVTSIQIIPDNYAGENPSIRVGGCANIRVITLKHKRNDSKRKSTKQHGKDYQSNGL